MFKKRQIIVDQWSPKCPICLDIVGNGDEHEEIRKKECFVHKKCILDRKWRIFWVDGKKYFAILNNHGCLICDKSVDDGALEVISEDFITAEMRVFHAKCANKCPICPSSVSAGTSIHKGGLLVCSHHNYKCQKCNQPAFPTDSDVFWHNSSSIHIACIRCVKCDGRVKVGNFEVSLPERIYTHRGRCDARKCVLCQESLGIESASQSISGPIHDRCRPQQHCCLCRNTISSTEKSILEESGKVRHSYCNPKPCHFCSEPIADLSSEVIEGKLAHLDCIPKCHLCGKKASRSWADVLDGPRSFESTLTFDKTGQLHCKTCSPDPCTKCGEVLANQGLEIVGQWFHKKCAPLCFICGKTGEKLTLTESGEYQHVTCTAEPCFVCEKPLGESQSWLFCTVKNISKGVHMACKRPYNCEDCYGWVPNPKMITNYGLPLPSAAEIGLITALLCMQRLEFPRDVRRLIIKSIWGAFPQGTTYCPQIRVGGKLGPGNFCYLICCQRRCACGEQYAVHPDAVDYCTPGTCASAVKVLVLAGKHLGVRGTWFPNFYDVMKKDLTRRAIAFHHKILQTEDPKERKKLKQALDLYENARTQAERVRKGE